MSIRSQHGPLVFGVSVFYRTPDVRTIAGLVSALSLGLSRSVAVAIVSRAFGGLFNPNVGLVQTCAGELATKEQQGKARLRGFLSNVCATPLIP